MSRRLLKYALEGIDEQQSNLDNKTVVMKGPLAEVMTKALNITYAKDDPATGQSQVDEATGEVKPALESQQQEVSLIQQLINSATASEAPMEHGVQVYGISRDDFNQQHLDEITLDLANDVNEEASPDYVVIVDGTRPSTNSEVAGVPEETLVKLESRAEAITKALGGRFYRSLEEFVESVDPELVKVMADAANPETGETTTENVEVPAQAETPEQTDRTGSNA